MSKYQTVYRVVYNTGCTDYNEELEYTIEPYYINADNTKIQRKGFNDWTEITAEIFDSLHWNRKSAEQCLVKYCCKSKDTKIAELEKQLENAVIPKFKIGQECYLIDNNFNYLRNRAEFNIVRSKIRKQQNWYYVENYGVNHEEDLFATKEEAQEKLKELKGE